LAEQTLDGSVYSSQAGPTDMNALPNERAAKRVTAAAAAAAIESSWAVESLSESPILFRTPTRNR
jgi:hypothetical protein